VRDKGEPIMDTDALFGDDDPPPSINRLMYPEQKKPSKKKRARETSGASDKPDDKLDDKPQKASVKRANKKPKVEKAKKTEDTETTEEKTDKEPTSKSSPKQSEAEKRGEKRKEAEKIKALRKAERKELEEYKQNTFKNLPPGVRQRRVRAEGEQLVEYVDVHRSMGVLKQLARNMNDQNLEQAKREEAQYLHEYLSEFLRLLKSNGSQQITLPGEHTESGTPRLVYVNKLNYHSRRGAGRRYTTIERTNTIKGKVVKVRMEAKQRGEEGSIVGNKKRNYGLQGCPKALRAQLSGAFNHDVDMRLAHPTIAVQMRDILLKAETDKEALKLLEDAKLEIFKDYVQNRDTPDIGWISEVCRHHEIEGTYEQQKDAIKRLFCRIMFGGSYKTWLKTPYGKDKTKLPKNGALEKVVQLEAELARLRKAVFASTRWKSFVEAERKWIEADIKHKGLTLDLHKTERSIFSRLMQTLENDILQVMIETLRQLGWTTTTLIFDGCHVLHRSDANLREALDKAQEIIRRETGFDIMLLEKPLFDEHKKLVDLRRL